MKDYQCAQEFSSAVYSVASDHAIGVGCMWLKVVGSISVQGFEFVHEQWLCVSV